MKNDMSEIHYKKIGWHKYELTKTAGIQTTFHSPTVLQLGKVKLGPYRWLTIFSGYIWDGCSGPTWDCEKSRRGCLFHDALYDLLEAGLLPMENKDLVDLFMYVIHRTDGFNKYRAWLYLLGVKLFGRFALAHKAKKIIIKTLTKEGKK